MATEDKDRLDEWLDSGLKQYGDVQPRAGLEGRIIANLEAQSRLAARRRWMLAFASVAVACTILIAARHSEMSRRTARTVARVSSPAAESPTTRPNTSSVLTTKKTLLLPTVQRHTRPRLNSVTARLYQFPSPRPLTDRELALAAYAKNFPKEAEKIAQEQETFEQEMERAQLELQNYTQQLNQER